MFNTIGLTLLDWSEAPAIASSVLLANEAHKLVGLRACNKPLTSLARTAALNIGNGNKLECERMNNEEAGNEPKQKQNPFVNNLYRCIRPAVQVLSVLMVMVIWWGVADVVYVLYSRISVHPYYLLEISDILATFGAFMAVLIAIEVFVNIVGYLSDSEIHIDIVLATAYMAVLRKIIILDYKEVSPDYVYATAALAVALAIGYWLTKAPPPNRGVAGKS